MSEYLEILPGLWSVRCIEYKRAGCHGPAYSPEPGVFICEYHARALGLIESPKHPVADALPTAPVEAEVRPETLDGGSTAPPPS